MSLSLDFNAIYNNIGHIEAEYRELIAIRNILDEMYPYFYESGNMYMYRNLSDQIKSLERSITGRIEILKDLVDDFKRINYQNENDIQDTSVMLKRIIERL